MRLRSTNYCMAWLIFTVGCIALTLYFLAIGNSSLFSSAPLILALYGAQGFVAELLGVRVSRRGVSFPRRLFVKFPFLVLWRRRIPAMDIERIASLSAERIRVYRRSSGRPEYVFPNSNQRSSFIKLSRGLFPSAGIFREG